MNADPDLVTAAGFSSGSYFSCYLVAANSSIIKGAGCLNGSLYNTTFREKIKLQENETTAKATIAKYVQEAQQTAKGFVDNDLFDSLDQLEDVPIYI